MTVKIVTDSGSDITQEEARELGITVVPLYLRFGDKVYRDGVDIDAPEFYQKLVSSPVHPSTSSPSPGDFAKVYEEVSQDAEEIVSIHITSKHSTTFNAALLGKELVEGNRCRIEVMDSQGVSMWQGLVAIAAAKVAGAQSSLHQVTERIRETIHRLQALALLDTLAYAVRGGRLGKAISVVESVLSVKPFITLRDGEIHTAGLARTRSKGIERLREFIRQASPIEDISIVYSTTPDEARTLTESVNQLFPNIVPRIARMGPALGVHAGPGTLAAIVKKLDSDS
jgi:DegV family protein with EDD domain